MKLNWQNCKRGVVFKQIIYKYIISSLIDTVTQPKLINRLMGGVYPVK